jgi:hypothetical protein
MQGKTGQRARQVFVEQVSGCEGGSSGLSVYFPSMWEIAT